MEIVINITFAILSKIFNKTKNNVVTQRAASYALNLNANRVSAFLYIILKSTRHTHTPRFVRLAALLIKLILNVYEKVFVSNFTHSPFRCHFNTEIWLRQPNRKIQHGFSSFYRDSVESNCSTSNVSMRVISLYSFQGHAQPEVKEPSFDGAGDQSWQLWIGCST